MSLRVITEVRCDRCRDTTETITTPDSQPRIMLLRKGWTFNAHEDICPGCRNTCPDEGTCHHSCPVGACFRVHNCGPLSNVYPGDVWPLHVVLSVKDALM